VERTGRQRGSIVEHRAGPPFTKTLGLLMSATLAALLGALVGAAASMGAMWIQQRHQTKRDLLKIAAELAQEDWKQRFDILSKHGAVNMPPVSVFVHYHAKVLEAMANGTYSPEMIQQLSEAQEAVMEAHERANEAVLKRRKKQT